MFSKRLKYLRKNKGLSQQNMADFLGISRQGYGKYEDGKSETDHKTLIKLANYFDVTTDYLLGYSDSPNLTAKDEKDIAKRMEKMKSDLKEGKGDGLNYMGEPMSEEAIETLLEALEHAERIATLANKKYTPKKYRDKE
ncbi:helix-turn-helix domain-containing protein [Virgibacillus dakarensis]|nr:helix-turn-helix domain-containing protein [Virgibacillus dakarensis]